MAETHLPKTADVIVIGAGIAGASVAAELSRDCQVLLLEMEPQPGYHTTGRSAALFAPTYGPKPIRDLTRASEAFFHAPPKGFTDQSLLSPRNVLMIARDDQMEVFQSALDEVLADAHVDVLRGADLLNSQPLLRPDYASIGYLDAGGSDIDVNALHHGYLRMMREAGGVLVNKAEVSALEHSGQGWFVQTAVGEFSAPIIVNAAGAWADEVGTLAGAEPIGLVPKRRTALIAAAPDGVDVEAMPLTADIEEAFYLKPDAGRLLLSPADETPSAPCDAQPEELDIAICVDRIMTAFDLPVRRIENKWAGLRSFVKDKSPVAGFSGEVDGFYWLAGQGGYGIQSAPALSQYAAAEIRRRSVPDFILSEGLDPQSLSPARLVGATRAEL